MSAHAPSLQPDDHAASLDERGAWLYQVRLFEDLRDQPQAISELAAVMETRHYPEGQAILSEGEEGVDAYFLISGQVRVQKRVAGDENFPVALLEAKDHPFFGEAALLASDVRSATILTQLPCTCLILHKSAFDRFCASRPEWALPVVRRIARVVLERLHKANNDVVLLYNALVSEVKG